MQDESPEGRDGSLTETEGFDDWLPVTEESMLHRAARPQLRRWGGLALTFLLGCGVCAAFFLSTGPGRVVTHRTLPASALVQSRNVDNATNLTSTAINVIEVDVHGDVKHPGVYTLPLDARVKDAVKAAGGYLHASDADNVNAAAQLTDGAEVVVSGPVLSHGPDPSSGPVVASSRGSASGTNTTPSGNIETKRVDLNTADLATLETLPDIGPARATAIITYRAQHGPFANVSDLTNVSGIGQGILSRIAPYLYVASRTG